MRLRAHARPSHAPVRSRTGEKRQYLHGTASSSFFCVYFILCPLFRCPQALVLDLAARVHKCTRAAYPPARSVTNGLERIVPLGTILSSSFSLLAAVLPLPIPLLFPGAARALASARSALSCARSLSNGREEAVPARYCLFTHFFFVFFLFYGLFHCPQTPVPDSAARVHKCMRAASPVAVPSGTSPRG